MELIQNLLSSYVRPTKVDAITIEANQTLVDQLLSNFAIEHADMAQVLATIMAVKSERVKLSMLNRLGEYSTSDRFALTDIDRELLNTDEEKSKNFFIALDNKYWYTLFNRINVLNLIPSHDAPNLKPYLTHYIDENPIAFNLENIKGLFHLMANLYDADVEKQRLTQLFSNFETTFSQSSDGEVKLKLIGSDIYKTYKTEIADRIGSALYFNDPKWFLNNKDEAKQLPSDLRGVEWMKFKNSNHVLTMTPETWTAFSSFYGLSL